MQARDCIFSLPWGQKIFDFLGVEYPERQFVILFPAGARIGCVIQYGAISATLTTTGRMHRMNEARGGNPGLRKIAPPLDFAVEGGASAM